MKTYSKYLIILFFSICLFCLTGCKKKYKITYYVDNVVYQTQTYNESASLSFPNPPEKAGYAFKGWSFNGGEISNGFVVNSNMNLTAVFESLGCKVTLKAGSGEFSDGSKEKIIYISENEVFNFVDVPGIKESSGRVFCGWYNGEELFEFGSTVTEEVTLRAKYTTGDKTFNINFHLNGGEMNSFDSKTYFSGEMVPFDIPTKEGFEFLGWYDNFNFYDDPFFYQDVNASGDKDYYACWNLTDVEYIDVIYRELLPEVIVDDIYMPARYQGVELAWSTNDENTLSSKGISNPAHVDKTVKVELTMYYDGEQYDYKKDVLVKKIEFQAIENPIAGYFYATGVTTMSDTVIRNLDIAYYAFAHVFPNGDVTIQNVSQFRKFVEDGKKLRKSGTRMVLSIAGGADNFSLACLNAGASKVADNIIKIVKDYNLDGVDIDWEFPGNDTDTQNLNLLCRVIKTKLSKIAEGGTPYLVTAAIPSSALVSRFDLRTLNDILDYVNMMSYDMNVAGKATHLCPLIKAYNDGGLGYGVDDGVNKFTINGLSKDKIIIGSAFYGKAYKTTNDGMNPTVYPGLGAPGELIHLQYQSGTVTYEYIKANIMTDPSYVRYWDKSAKTSYLYSQTKKIFITFEDVESIEEKTKFAYENGLGIMFWEYGYDADNELTDAMCNKMEELQNN